MPMGTPSAGASTTKAAAEKRSALADVQRLVGTLQAAFADAFDLLDREDEIKRLHSQAQLDAAQAAKDKAAAGDALVEARAEAIRIGNAALEEADTARQRLDEGLRETRAKLEADREAFGAEVAARSTSLTQREADADARLALLEAREVESIKRENALAARDAALKTREDAVAAAEAALAEKARDAAEMARKLAS